MATKEPTVKDQPKTTAQPKSSAATSDPWDRTQEQVAEIATLPIEDRMRIMEEDKRKWAERRSDEPPK